MHRRLLRALACSCLLAGSLPAQAPADLIVRNARIHTLNPAAPVASAVAIRDGVFVAVGAAADLRAHTGPQTRILDAGGRAVIPGLIESHVHPVGASRGETVQPFRQLHSIPEILEWVRARAAERPAGQWIQLPRVDVTRIRERRLPNRADLDAAAPRHPAVFTWQYANRTVQVLNSSALAAAGITGATTPPRGAKIHLGADGAPTGVMENASALLVKFLPGRALTEEQHLASLETLLRRYNEIGITSIGERNTNPDGHRLFQKLRAAGRLTARVTTTITIATDGTEEGTAKAIRALPFGPGEGDDWVRVGPLKVGVDGGALYGTAYLREPYPASSHTLYGITDPAYRGDLRLSPEKLTAIIRTGHRLGWQLCAHVTGDAGVDAVLDAVEAADRDSPIAPRRYNLLHAYFANEETARRAARLGVCVDTQPAWYYKDGDALHDALGRQRMDQFIGVQIWRKAGVKVALNSDHMQGFDPDTSLNPYNPFLAMQAAVTRRTEGGNVYGADQRISREDALRMFTLDAAWLSFDETRKGTIEVGKLGDLAILTADPLTCPENELHAIRAVATVVGGKVVHERR